MQTTLCYLERDGSYLMLHRIKKKNDINRDKWIGVGGKFEEGESPEDCMRREVLEETGLVVRRWRYRGIVTFVSDLSGTEYMHLFTIDGWDGDVRDCDEGQLRWIEKEKLLSLPMWEGDRIFLELIRQESEPFFSLKLIYRGEKLIAAEKDGKRIPLAGPQPEK
jgi:8-oxo-dGTP diphosphatase